MIEGLAFIGARATWNLQHSAMPGAPTLPDQALRRPRRTTAVRPHVAAVLRRTAERLDPERSAQDFQVQVGPGTC
ncbi:hypothetical protein [Cellulomonas sp. Leaf334]|uniref:hypothetical protein n=1 Tax=Cellulomonas sp. Leaf334 TaxID=1736339 RepID=UPI0006F48408|nr:hypothetical protein [Cellulomonas sp. Leaf334]KQR10398.1 hypothetical protein ASF78_17065 [Cellulomonas sp. Leaf334]